MRPLHSLSLAAFFIMSVSSHAAVSIYMSSPDRQNVVASDFGSGSSYTFQNENFNNVSLGAFTGLSPSSNTGTYAVTSGAPYITNQYDYGGGLGQDRYLRIDKGQSVSITFASPISYFGMQWTAGNSGNQITFYDENGVKIGTFDTVTLTTLLPNTPGNEITAVNGSKYLTTDYYGLPGDRATNLTEPYAYVHFINQGSGGISRIEMAFTEQWGGFESDNHSTSFNQITIDPGTSTLVPVGEVPEPSSVFLALSGVSALFLRRRRVA